MRIVAGLLALAGVAGLGGGAAAADSGRWAAAPGLVHATLVGESTAVDVRLADAADPQRTPSAVAAPAAPAQARGPLARWPALDGRTDDLYLKQFRRLAVGRRAEIWVATNLRFPAGDCRNTADGGGRIRVTAAQAATLARAFDSRIYGRFAPLFGTPRQRNGSGVQGGLGARGSRVVVLVDNIRDDNYYNRNNEREIPSIAGFYAPILNAVVNRNVVTLDAYDWTHRLGATPPHRPSTDICRNAPARPQLYEGVLAHEYHHLLHDLADPDERTWLGEGLADYAAAVAGYGRGALSVNEIGFAGSVQCLLGWTAVATNANPRPRSGGPENSLTVWGDAGDQEIVCDYGAAYTFVQFLADRFGAGVVTQLHRDVRDGLASVAAAAGDPSALVRDWAAMLALDGVLERGTPLATGTPEAASSRSLAATINWDNPRTHSSPGAPANGSDYVRLRRADGSYLPAAELTSLSIAPRTRRTAFALQVVAYGTDPAIPAARVVVPLVNGAAAVDRSALAAIDARADVVAAIVTYEDPQERVTSATAYDLVVNGVRQPGG